MTSSKTTAIKMKVEIKKLENAQVEISVSIPNKEFESHRERVEDHMIKHVEIDGFRKGNIPRDVAIKKIGEMPVLEEMAQHIISEKYPQILADKKIRAIGQPQIAITKIAPSEDLEFKITTAIVPEIKIANYKKIAKEINKKDLNIKIEDKEVEEATKNLQRMRAQQEHASKLKEGEKQKALKDFKDDELPELTDEWVKSLGNFKNVTDFKDKLRKNMEEEKKMREEEKRRLEIIEEIANQSKVEVPEILTNFELEKIFHQMEHNISMSGHTVDEYLKQIKKTKEELQKEWRPQAEKNAKIQLLVNHIAATEKIDPSDEEIKGETKQLMEQYKNSPEKMDENHVRSYIATVLMNRKVFEFLEGQK